MVVQVQPFFAVPFGFAQFENCATLNEELRALFLEREKEGVKYANPRPFTQRNRQVYESNFQLFRSPEPCIQKLKSFCWSNLLGMIAELSGYDAATMRRMLIYNDCWFHVTRRGGFFGLHNHPMASWSGVYCVDPGKHDADKPDSGMLTFLNPSTFSAMYQDAATASLRGPFGSGIRYVKFEPGQLVLFPSWVLHDVKPFEGDGERITVAFNCWFQLKDEAPPPAA
ncbi:MAG TPA: putative 2OG-Fe(II) oxygenase [Lacunisphaera sp.]|jgi:uncharacterized protein (TIGR02466 family)|nr:putative 2OG-Fe(II) oxygenase [Lacunisphaera sp.]